MVKTIKKSILIIGVGGREHAIGWKLKQSKYDCRLYFAPGNGGTATLGTNIAIPVDDIGQLLMFAQEKRIDLTVVGPENTLAAGVVDAFEKKGLRIFGPTKKATQLESSKAWAVKFMTRHRIPCPQTRVFSDYKKGLSYAQKLHGNCVIKADGLALGKGVFVCSNFQEARFAIQSILIKKEFGNAGKKLLIQEKLEGREISLISFTDGKTSAPLVSAQDYKRVFDHDRGPNTGGMGTVAPSPFMTPFKGILYGGIMLTKTGPKVLEFNVRFGDPETQVQLPLLKTDLYEVFIACTEGILQKKRVELEIKKKCICVILAAGGYPRSYRKGELIHGLDSITDGDFSIFHAGTRMKDNLIRSNGGRVLGITRWGKNLNFVRKKIYQSIGIKGVHFRKMQYRTDIGKL